MEETKDKKVETTPPVTETKTEIKQTTTTQATTEKKSSGLKTCIIVLVIIIGICFVCSLVGVGGSALLGKSLVNQVNEEISKIPEKVEDSVLDEVEKNLPDGDSLDGTNEILGKNLPANFPSDVPLIDGYKITSASTKTTSKGEEFIVIYTVDKTGNVVDNFYATVLPQNGWDVKEKFNLFGNMTLLEKDNKELTLVVLASPTKADKPTTMVTLTIQPK